MWRYGIIHPARMGVFGLGAGWIFNLIFWIFLIIMVVIFIRMVNEKGQDNYFEKKVKPLEILKSRYAKREITKKEFEEMKKEIS